MNYNNMKTISILAVSLALCGNLFAQQKVSERVTLAPGDLNPAVDLLPVTDISAGADGSKKMTIDEVFEGWGFTSYGESIAKAADASAVRTLLALGTAATLNHGTAIGNLVRLDPTTAKLPAVDGSLLTNLPDNDTFAGKAVPSGTVVGTSDTQTLSNKTLSDPQINMGGDGTGDLYYRTAGGLFNRLPIGTANQLLKVVGGLPEWATVSMGGTGDLLSTNNLSDLTNAGTARTNLGITLPAGALVGTTDSQTLTNKTLTTPVINAGSDATGDIYYRSAGGVFTRLAVGTNGHVLKLASGLPSWAADADTFAGKAVPSGVVVGDTDTQTLSGKTLTSPKMNFGSDATGDIYYRDASGNLVRLGVGTNGYVLTLAAGLPSWAAGGGGGGLTNFTESLNSSTPNGTVTVARLIATNAATNVDVALSPKGTGALLAQIPDNSSTGGNKRGLQAVDWQLLRTTNTMVANGAQAVIGGGQNNTSSGTGSTVAGGDTNAASGNLSFIGGGSSNTASTTNATIGGGTGNNAGGSYGFVGGGNGNTNSGSFSYQAIAGGQSNSSSGANTFIGGGQSNSTTGTRAAVVVGLTNTASGLDSIVTNGRETTASGPYSTAGGMRATNRGTHASQAYAGGYFAAVGDAQRCNYILRNNTTNATQTELLADGFTAGASTRISLPANSTYSFTGLATARSSTGDAAGWRFRGTIEQGAAAANTAIVGTVVIDTVDTEAGSSTWALAIDADTTNGTLRFRVTGVAATNIRWVAAVDTVQVTY